MQHDIPFRTVVSSLKRMVRYSLGSVALGSLIVSIIEWVRFILETLRRRLKFVDSAHDSWFGKTVSSSSQCCLGCIDWTLKSVNRNAYIMVNINNSFLNYLFNTHVLVWWEMLAILVGLTTLMLKFLNTTITDCHHRERILQGFCASNWVDHEERVAHWESECDWGCDSHVGQAVCKPAVCVVCFHHVG